MNQKLLIILSGIALLGVGTFFLLIKTHKGQDSTVGDFKHCVMSNLKNCSSASSFDEQKKCKSAEFYATHRSNSACAQFNNYLDKAQSTDLLNVNDNFVNCYLDPTIVSHLTEISSFYYNQIFTPIVKNCLGF